MQTLPTGIQTTHPVTLIIRFRRRAHVFNQVRLCFALMPNFNLSFLIMYHDYLALYTCHLHCLSFDLTCTFTKMFLVVISLK